MDGNNINYGNEIMQLTRNVAELATISKATEKGVDELRSDFKKLNDIVLNEVHNSKDIKKIEVQVACIDRRLKVVEDKGNLYAKAFVKKLFAAAGLLIMGGLLSKIESIVKGVLQWLSS